MFPGCHKSVKSGHCFCCLLSRCYCNVSLSKLVSIRLNNFIAFSRFETSKMSDSRDTFYGLISLRPLPRGARWFSGRATDSGARGRGFDTYLRRIVSLSKDTFTPRKVLVLPRKRWLRPDMTEKLFTETLSLNKSESSSSRFVK